MTWFVVGFAFGLGAIAATLMAGLAIILLGAISTEREARRKTREAMCRVKGWEGTD